MLEYWRKIGGVPLGDEVHANLGRLSDMHAAAGLGGALGYPLGDGGSELVRYAFYADGRLTTIFATAVVAGSPYALATDPALLAFVNREPIRRVVARPLI